MRNLFDETPRKALWFDSEGRGPTDVKLTPERIGPHVGLRLEVDGVVFCEFRPGGLLLDVETASSLGQALMDLADPKVTITESELNALMKRIHSGAVDLFAYSEGEPPERWSEDKTIWENTFAGNVFFYTSDGWVLVVFNDCSEWDYLDTVITPDGRVSRFEHIHQLGVERGRHFEPRTKREELVWEKAPRGEPDEEVLARIQSLKEPS